MAGYLGAALMGLASGMSAYDEKQKKDAANKQQQDLENQRITLLNKEKQQQISMNDYSFQKEQQKNQWDQKYQDIQRSKPQPNPDGSNPQETQSAQLGYSLNQQANNDPKSFSSNPIVTTNKAQLTGTFVDYKTQQNAGTLQYGTSDYWKNIGDQAIKNGLPMSYAQDAYSKADSASEIANKNVKESLANRKEELADAAMTIDSVDPKNQASYDAALKVLKQNPNEYGEVTKGFNITGDVKKDVNFIEAIKHRALSASERLKAQNDAGHLQLAREDSNRKEQREQRAENLVTSKNNDDRNFVISEVTRKNEAEKMGIPFYPSDPVLQSLPNKQKQMYLQKIHTQNDAIFKDSIQTGTAAKEVKDATLSFLAINEKNATDWINGPLGKYSLNDQSKAAYSEMNKQSGVIVKAGLNSMNSKRLTVAEQKLITESSLNTNIPYATNKEIGKQIIAIREQQIEETQLLQKFKQVNPDGDARAFQLELSAFYLNNPAVVVNPTTGQLIDNPNRVKFVDRNK